MVDVLSYQYLYDLLFSSTPVEIKIKNKVQHKQIMKILQTQKINSASFLFTDCKTRDLLAMCSPSNIMLKYIT